MYVAQGVMMILCQWPFGQGFYGEGALRLCLFPQPRCRFVHGQQLPEINGFEAFTHNHTLAAHLAQHKTFLYSHYRL